MTYKLKNLELGSHGWPQTVMMIHDTAGLPSNKLGLQAQVASGDYFAKLATQLDQVSRSLKRANQDDYVVLESIIDDLLYLQTNYQVTKQ